MTRSPSTPRHECRATKDALKDCAPSDTIASTFSSSRVAPFRRHAACAPPSPRFDTLGTGPGPFPFIDTSSPPIEIFGWFTSRSLEISIDIFCTRGGTTVGIRQGRLRPFHFRKEEMALGAISAAQVGSRWTKENGRGSNKGTRMDG